MGFEKFIQDAIDARNLRLKDPAIQAKLDAERIKTQEAWADMGNQTLDTLGRIVWNSTGKLAEPVGKGKGSKLDPAGQLSSGAVDSTLAVTQLVGKILKASGRTAWYGIRKGIVK
jgi:hypothetical protein